MKAEHVRGLIISLSVLALILSHLLEHPLLSLLLTGTCMLLALIVLYCNLDRLTDLSPGNPKMKTLRFVTLFDIAVFLFCIGFAALADADFIQLSQRGAEYFLTGLLSVIMLVIGNVCPKLPFSRHTGLRLPWTVRDEETWIVAHRIIGYISLPLVILFLAATPVVDNYKALFLSVVIVWIGIPGLLSGVFFYRKFRG